MTKTLAELSALADQYYLLREARLAKQKEVDELQAQETAAKDELINAISTEDATGVAGKIISVSVVKKQKPQVADWDALYTYVRRRGAWDLLQRRLSETAVKARWEEGQTIPGVEVFSVKDLSIHKL